MTVLASALTDALTSSANNLVVLDPETDRTLPRRLIEYLGSSGVFTASVT